MKVLRIFGLVLTLLTLAPMVFGQNFEGIITYKETSRGEVVTKKIYVKGDNVRVETYLPNDENALKGVKLVNLESGRVTALLPSRKLYLDVPSRKNLRPLEVDINRTDESTKLLALDTRKTVVKSDRKRTEVEFWIAKGNFTFFGELMSVLGKNGNMGSFFSKIADEEVGSLPLKTTEKRIDGTLIKETEVIKINTEVVSDKMFTIPENYTLQEK